MERGVTEKTMVEQPIRFRREGEIAIVKWSFGWKRCFLRGGIAFPEYDKTRERFSGAITVCAMVDGNAVILFNETFEKYDFRLAELFNAVYEKYGVLKYYYREDGCGKEDALRFSITAGRRRKENRDAVYPILIPLSFPNDYHAMESFMLRSANGTVTADENSKLVSRLGDWTVDDGTAKAPPEIKSALYVLAGMDRDIGRYKAELEGISYA